MSVDELLDQLPGELDYLFQEGITNQELQRYSDRLRAMVNMLDGFMQDNELIYQGNPAMTQRTGGR